MKGKTLLRGTLSTQINDESENSWLFKKKPDGKTCEEFYLNAQHVCLVVMLVAVQHVRPTGDMGRQAGGRVDGRAAAWWYRRRDGACVARHHVGHGRGRVVAGAVGAADAVETLLVAVVVAGEVGVGDGQTRLGLKRWAGVGEGGEPGVLQDGGQGGALGGVHAQALAHEVLAFGRNSVAEAKLGHADLLVGLEWYVAADHVKEEDSQRPDGCQLAVITVLSDPLGRRVHAGSWKLDGLGKALRSVESLQEKE